MANTHANVSEVYVIGGEQIYRQALSEEFKNYCKLVIATRINKSFEADVFMPEFEDSFSPVHISQTYSQPKDGITFDYCFYGNKTILQKNPMLVPTKLMQLYPKHAEMQYLEAIKDIIATGQNKDDRTGTGIFTKFGY